MGRARLCAILIEKLIHGGQMMTSDLVENYPGFPEGISGPDLSDRMRQQAERFGLKIVNGDVTGIIPGTPKDPSTPWCGGPADYHGDGNHRHRGQLSAPGDTWRKGADRERGEFLRHLRRGPVPGPGDCPGGGSDTASPR